MNLLRICLVLLLAHSSTWAQTPPDISKFYGGHPDELSRLKLSVISKPATQHLRTLPAAEKLSAPEQQALQQLEKIWPQSPVRSMMWLKGGAIVAEYYKSDTLAHTPVLGMSMSKSVIGLAVGYALCAGQIRSLDDTMGQYVTEVSASVFATTKIRHLLTMTSGAGYVWNMQDAGRFNLNLLYGSQNVLDDLNSFKTPAKGAGTHFSYSNRDTNALGILLQKVAGKPLAQVISETVWHHAGAEHDALIANDHAGQGIASAFIWASARDWARVGLLVSDLLQPNQANSCMGQYMQQATSKLARTQGDVAADQDTGYGFQFWTEGAEYPRGTVLLKGLRGQRMAIFAKNQSVLSTMSTEHSWPSRDFWSVWRQITRLP